MSKQPKGKLLYTYRKGVIRTLGAQRRWWAIIELNDDVTPPEEMTEQEIRQQTVITNG